MKENSLKTEFPKVFVISLPSALDRRQHIEEELGKHAIPFVFFDALNGEQALEAIQKHGLQIAPGALSAGELGCMMSHVEILAALVQSDAPTVTILEDDIFLGRDANFFLTQQDWIPSPAQDQIIKLEKFLNRRLLSWQSVQVGSRKLRLLLQDHYGTAGYIVGRNAATGLLAMLRATPLKRPIDHLIFDDFRVLRPKTMWQLNPALCIQEKVQNEICNLGNHLEQDRSYRHAIAAHSSEKTQRWRKNLRFFLVRYWQKKIFKTLHNSRIRFE